MAYISQHYELVKANLTGTMVDISGAVMKFTIKTETNIGEHFTFDSLNPKYAAGARKVSGEMEVEHDAAAASVYTGLQTKHLTNAVIAFEAYSPDAATGSHKVTGNLLIKGMDPITGGEAGKGDVKKSKIAFHVTSMTVGVAP